MYQQVHGKGRIEKRGANAYRIRFNLGRDSITGNYSYSPWRTVHGNKNDAQRALEEYRREIESGLRFDLREITFAQYAESYLTARENSGTLARGTMEDDRFMIKTLNRYLDNIRLVDIDSLLLNDIISRMKKVDNIGDVTRHDLVVMIKRLLREAVMDGIIIRNPSDRIKTPKIPKPKRNSMKDFEAARLLQVLDSYPITRNTIAIYIGLGTGMRKGEVLGLAWSEVDFDGHSITVSQAVDRWKNKKAPKTDSGNRVISVDAHLISRLKAWKSIQAEMLLAQGITLTGSTPVCSNKTGGLCEQTRFYHWFRDFCVDNGFARYVDDDGNEIPKRLFDAEGIPVDENGRRYSRSNKRPEVTKHYQGLKFHELRHTHATLLIGNGVDVKTVQSRLGHSRASITLDFYAHADEERDRQASDLFSNLLSTNRIERKVVNL